MTASSPRLLRISEVARATGLGCDILRHYERLGLLEVRTRSEGGFRLYAEEAIPRVRSIQAALALGFRLQELAESMHARRKNRAPCRKVRALAAEKLTHVERELERLRALRDALERVISDWDDKLRKGPGDTPALLLESLAEHPAIDLHVERTPHDKRTHNLRLASMRRTASGRLR